MQGVVGRWKRAIAVAVAVVLVVACQGSSPPQGSTTPNPASEFRMMVRSSTGDGDIELVVIDRTGTVVGLGPAVANNGGVASRRLSVRYPGEQPDSINVTWSTTICAEVTTLTVSSFDSQLLLDMTAAERVDCDSMGVTYAATIRLGGPMSETSIVAHDQDVDASTYGLLIRGAGGLPIPLLIIDRSRQVKSVATLELPAIATAGGLEASNPGGAGQIVDLAWQTATCDDEGELTIAADDDLKVELVMANVRPRECIGPVIPTGVRLTMVKATPPEAIDLTFRSAH